MPKQYPEEFKKQVTAICLAGTPFALVSERYHISLNTLYRWRKEYQQEEDQSATKDYSTLCRQHERQNHILQIIRLDGLQIKLANQGGPVVVHRRGPVCKSREVGVRNNLKVQGVDCQLIAHNGVCDVAPPIQEGVPGVGFVGDYDPVFAHGFTPISSSYGTRLGARAVKVTDISPQKVFSVPLSNRLSSTLDT